MEVRRFYLVGLSVLLLQACGGGSSSPPPPNESPTANAGVAMAVTEGTEVMLSGNGDDSDGTISRFSWTQTAGPDVTLTNADSATASFLAPDVTGDEVFTFRLSVTDDDDASSTDTVSITVEDVLAGQIKLGPVVGATLDFFPLSAPGMAALFLVSEDGPDVTFAGRVRLTPDSFDDAEWYVVVASGGQDVDPDDDGVIESPRDLMGRVHGIVRGDALNGGDWKINALTEAGYQSVRSILVSSIPLDEKIVAMRERLDASARSLLDADLDGDQVLDHRDLYRWDATTQGARVSATGGTIQALTENLLNGERPVMAAAMLTHPVLFDGFPGQSGRGMALDDANDRLFVGMSQSGSVRVYDVSNIGNPLQIASFSTMSSVNGITLEGTTAYVANNGSLEIFDITDIEAAVMLSRVENIAFPNQVVRIPDSDVMLVPAFDLLATVDVSDPAAPSVLQTFDVEVSEVSISSTHGPHAYGRTSTGVVVFDLSQPTAISQVGTFGESGPLTSRSLGNITFSGDGTTMFAIEADRVGERSFVHAFQFPDTPVNPVLIGSYGEGTSGFSRLTYGASTDTLVLYSGFPLILSLDVSDPANMSPLHRSRHQNMSCQNVMFERDGLLYCSIGGRLFQVLDISPPPVDTRLSFEHPDGSPTHMVIDGDTAFVGYDGFDFDQFVLALDLSATTTITELGRIGVNRRITSLEVGNDVLYVGMDVGEVDAINVSDPTAMVLRENFDSPQSGHTSARLSEDGATLVVTVRDTLHFLDPNDVNIEFSSLANEDVVHLAVSGDLAYTTDRDGLEIFDFSNPLNVTMTGSVTLPERGYELTLDGDLAYISSTPYGLQLVDISDPATPVVLGDALERSYSANTAIAITGDVGYIHHSWDMVAVLDLTRPDQIPVEISREYFIAPERIVASPDQQFVYVLDALGIHRMPALSRDAPWDP